MHGNNVKKDDENGQIDCRIYSSPVAGVDPTFFPRLDVLVQSTYNQLPAQLLVQLPVQLPVQLQVQLKVQLPVLMSQLPVQSDWKNYNDPTSSCPSYFFQTGAKTTTSYSQIILNCLMVNGYYYYVKGLNMNTKTRVLNSVAFLFVCI